MIRLLEHSFLITSHYRAFVGHVRVVFIVTARGGEHGVGSNHRRGCRIPVPTMYAPRIRKSPETKEREYRESLERYRMAIHDTVDQQRQNIIRERRAMEIEELLQILEW